MAGLIRRINGKKALSLALALVVAFTMMFGSVGMAEAKSVSASKVKSAFTKTGDYLYSIVNNPTTESIGGTWVMYGLGYAGYDMSDEYVEIFRQNIINALDEGNGILHARNFAVYDRVILACDAVGIDATDIGGYNLVEALADFPNVKWVNVINVSFALLALDYGNYEMPERTDSYPYGTLTEKETDRQNSRQRMINYILSQQYDDGGWNLSEKGTGSGKYGQVSDVDTTAMVMVSLGPYMKQAKVKTAVSKAITYLSKAQQSDGGFSTWGTTNSESCSQVICALLSCGINPDTDSRFIKNGNSVIDALMSFYTEETDANGNKACGFKHVNTASGGYQPVYNQMATEQAYYALAMFYKCAPSKVTLSKAAKAAKGKIKVTYKKASVNTTYVQKKAGKTATVSGYQIYLSTSKNFTTKTTTKVTVSGASSLSKTVTGLKAGKTYYVKVRAYKTVNGQKVYGAFSSSKKVKC